MYAFFFMHSLSALTADELSFEAESNVSNTGVPSPSVQAPFENTNIQSYNLLKCYVHGYS